MQGMMIKVSAPHSKSASTTPLPIIFHTRRKFFFLPFLPIPSARYLSVAGWGLAIGVSIVAVRQF